MAASDKKLQSFNAFNAGEYSKDLAGRTDLESFGSSTRYCSNFLSLVSGGLKKFYGTRHITEQALTEGFKKIKLIPFINKYEPMAFVLYGTDDGFYTDKGIKVGLIYGNKYKDLAIELPNTINVDELRWQQINDKLVLVHKTIQPMCIDFYGKDSDGEYIFDVSAISFTEIPYFPVGQTDEYFGDITTNGVTGTITVTVPSDVDNVKAPLPAPLIGQTSFVRSGSERYDGVYLQHLKADIGDATVTLYRIRNNVTTSLATGKANTGTWSSNFHMVGLSNSWATVDFSDSVTQERVLQVVKTVYPAAYIANNAVVLRDISDHQNGDSYYIELSVGAIKTYYVSPGQQERVPFSADTYVGEVYVPAATTSLDLNSLLGRKIKFYFNEDTVISPWWQSKSVTVGDYAYSNGHWYKALSSGTCGNVQPSHTFGVRSDGGVSWQYVHSGSNTGSVISVESANTFKVQVLDGELPVNTGNVYKIYATSIWGKDNIHPSDIYMVGNRLGFVCNTLNYGSWNAMSVVDDYFNFSTEEHGEQLDTSAIVHLVGNNESSDINWVLARKDVYMGGYSGEYHITPSAIGNRTGAYTPTTTYAQNISNMGGRAVVPLKYKQLNMFVGLTGKELYTVAYDYTIDDYTPKSLGYLTEHIMDRGIKRIVALNNKDRNIYLLHDTKQMSLFNFASEQKVMGFTELDFADDVIDFCSAYARDEVAGYVVVKRNVGKITIERFAIEESNYVFDEILQGDGETFADFQPIPHFANREVYIRYGLDFSQFVRVVLDADGDISHDATSGVYLPQSEYFKVGIPMTAELHTQPAFGNKVEGHQQQSLSMYLRIVNSGAFEYGSSVDFAKYFKHEYWNAQQEYGVMHRLYTGDMKLEIPLGYAEAANQGEGPYPNTSAVGINIRSDSPEPLNILSIQEIYR